MRVEIFVAGPSAVEEGIEGEREIGGGEDDEVKVTQEKGSFGYCRAQAETVKSLLVCV